MTNFDSFADVAISAEKQLHIDMEACVLNCRRAMEFAIKWMYSVEGSLVMPYQDTLVSLMSTEEFRDIVDPDFWRRLDFIRKVGNNAGHNGKKINLDQVKLCLENLYIFLDFVAYCYAKDYTEGEVHAELLEESDQFVLGEVPSISEIDLKALIAENQALKEQLTARREEQQTYVPKLLELSEYKTRKIYIDTMLRDAGWTKGKTGSMNWNFREC